MADRLPIESLLPHRGAMRFLDEADVPGPGRATCRGVVRPDNPFVRDGVLDPLARVEYVAQAAAALVSSRDPDRGPVHGWLVAARNVDLEDVEVRAGDVLEVEVVEAARVGDFASFDGVVRAGDTVVARGNVKVFRAGEEDAP